MVCAPKKMAYGRRSSRLGSSVRTRGSQKYVRARVDRSPRAYAGGRARRNYARGAATAAAHRGHPMCTRLYAASIVDPSGVSSKGACLPAGFPMPSQKIRAFSRGLLSTGTGGDGFIAWTPALANDYGSVTTVTSATSVGTAGTLFSAFTNVVFAAMSKIPYTTAQITGGLVEGRLVSGCIRIRYAGTEDARSGIVSLIEDPDHIDLWNLSTNLISNFDSCGKQRVYGDGAWHQINWSGPCKQAEQEYVQTAAFTGAIRTHVISISGTTTAAGALGPAPFEYECWQNLEFLGRDVVGKTNNTLDPSGTSTVIGEAKKLQSQSDPLNPTTGKSLLHKLGSLTKPKEGGTFVGNALQGLVSAINPMAGLGWSVGRAGVNAIHRKFYSGRR